MRHSSHLHLHFHTHHRAARYDVDMTKGSITKHLINFALPLMVGNLFQQLYNMVDTWVVGNYVSNEAFSAVGTVTPIINTLIGFFLGLSSGAGVVISQYYGAGREDKVRQAVHTSLVLTLLMGAVFTAAGIAMTPLMLRLMRTPAEVAPEQTTYLTIYFAGVMGLLLYNMGSGILRAVGDSKRPLYFLIASCLVNIVLDLLFVAVLGMGVTGAAIATIASQFFSAILTLIALLRTQDSYRLIVSKIRFHRDLLFDIIKIGLPAGLQSAMYSISNLLIQSSINSFGTDTIAAWTAYGKVDSIFWMIMGAYGVSITTFAGQNFGAGKYDRIKKSVRICLGLAAVTSLFLSFIVLNFGGTILLLFTRDTNVINICIGMMRVVSPAYITYICIEILSGTCRGCGDSFFPMLLTCFGVCVLRILWITIAVPLRHEVATVAFSYPLTWTITSILFILYYKRGKWMQKDTLRNAPQGQGKDA